MGLERIIALILLVLAAIPLIVMLFSTIALFLGLITMDQFIGTTVDQAVGASIPTWTYFVGSFGGIGVILAILWIIFVGPTQ